MKVCFPINTNEGMNSIPYNHFGSAKMFIVVDYYVSNKQPALIFITSEQNVYLFETDDIVPGYVAAFYENGTLAQ